MIMSAVVTELAARCLLSLPVVCSTDAVPAGVEVAAPAELFAPGVVSTESSDVRLTLSPDGRTAVWFTRNRAGGPGEYDIWISSRTTDGWGVASPAPFNSPQRDFDPAFSADGRFIYFCSNRPGGLGGDDLYRVAVLADGFGAVEHLGANVNSAADEWAPMLSPDGHTLLFSSNGRGAQRFDLFVSARLADDTFDAAAPLPGAINTVADEFDATFLADNVTIVFARSPNLQTDRVTLVYSSLRPDGYDAGVVLPSSVNAVGQNTYGPMLDWSDPSRLTISSQRPESRAGSTDIYVFKYRLTPIRSQNL